MIRESHSHIVATAKDALFNVRARTLESHNPSPDASTMTNDAAVAAEMDVTLLKELCAGISTKEAFKWATELFSTVNANI